mgnify:CR=1 FL=1
MKSSWRASDHRPGSTQKTGKVDRRRPRREREVLGDDAILLAALDDLPDIKKTVLPDELWIRSRLTSE